MRSWNFFILIAAYRTFFVKCSGHSLQNPTTKAIAVSADGTLLQRSSDGALTKLPQSNVEGSRNGDVVTVTKQPSAEALELLKEGKQTSNSRFTTTLVQVCGLGAFLGLLSFRARLKEEVTEDDS
eukprot:TRINITY_DN10593_c0_g1_i11.p1 TRINITY_DN10593_c0_g1~~TRINITY_DN10593_c0_g1_i11.p1  ORF type:complete len:125 (+),score=27.85 TRINITY_DN10593_c0_g1_i11:73-447(+)